MDSYSDYCARAHLMTLCHSGVPLFLSQTNGHAMSDGLSAKLLSYSQQDPNN